MKIGEYERFKRSRNRCALPWSLNAPICTVKNPPVGSMPWRENFHAHRHDSRADGINLARRGKRKIDDAIVDKRPAIRDAHGRGFSVVEIRHAHHGFKRQRAVRRRQFVHVVDFAIRGAPPVEGHPVPGGVALFDVARRRRALRWLAAFWRRRGRRRRRWLRGPGVRRAFGGFDRVRRCGGRLRRSGLPAGW